MVVAHLAGPVWAVPLALGSFGIAWFIPIIAGAVASYFANKSQGGGANTTSHNDVPAGANPPGPQGGLIFEQGSPYWPGSTPTYASNAFTPPRTGSSSSSQSLSTTNTSGVQDTTTTPFITPQYQPVESALRSQVQARLDSPYSLPRGYQANGIANINDIFNATDQSIGNRVASAGLNGPIAQGPYVQSANARAKSLVGFTNDLPMQERAARTEDLQLASALTEAFGKGMKSHTTSQSKSTTLDQSSSHSSGAGVPMPLPGDAILNSYLQGKQNPQGGGSWFGNALQYAALVAGIYSQLKGNKGAGTSTDGK